MAKATPVRRSLLTTEQADELDRDMLRLAIEEAQKLARLPKRVTSTSPRKPDVSSMLSGAMRRQLDDEVIIAALTDDNGGIQNAEFRNEISKKALIGLRANKLKEMARGLNLPVGGNLEQLATRIANHYDWRQESIARAIALAETDEHEKGFVSRLFPLRDMADLGSFEADVEPLSGRYIRVGVARWIVFGAVALGDQEVAHLPGSFRAYRASVDVRLDGSKIQPVATEQNFNVTVGRNKVLEIHQGGQAAAQLAALALGQTTGLQILGHIPNAGAGAVGASAVVHQATEFYLDLIYTRLRKAGFDGFDLKVVKFRLPDDERKSSSVSRPALRAVRFEGAHLLDSVDACKLIAVDGRPLQDMTFTATLGVGAEKALKRFTMRISIDDDHVLIHTAFSGHEPGEAQRAHLALLEAVSLEVKGGVADSGRLDTLIERVRQRAAETAAPDEANILIEDEYSDDDPELVAMP